MNITVTTTKEWKDGSNSEDRFTTIDPKKAAEKINEVKLTTVKEIEEAVENKIAFVQISILIQ